MSSPIFWIPRVATLADDISPPAPGESREAATGRRVLGALAFGRAEAQRAAQARAAALTALVLDHLARDCLRHPAQVRGRAGRIARELARSHGLRVSERHVRRIISDTLSDVSDSQP